MEIIYYILILLLSYIYFGYPLLLVILGYASKKKSLVSNEDMPIKHVTFIISIYNEDEIIRKKILNTIELDYPKDKLQIIVVSDASSDGSDEIVTSFGKCGVSLVRQKERLGKTSGINLAIKEAVGDILVFSDANSMYEKDAIRNLVKHFSDPSIGYVVGAQLYTGIETTKIEAYENMYWQYEMKIKQLESKVASVVGGDGAIYAVRRDLYEPLLNTDINDFVNPLQVIYKGFRGIFEPNAICFEYGTNDYRKEFRRKIRIINRSWKGLWRVRKVLNPLRFGIFSISLISHKLLRWLVPFMLIMLFFVNITLVKKGFMFNLSMLLQLSFYMFSFVGFIIIKKDKNVPKYFYVPFYFCLVNCASLIGIYKSLTGESIVTWTPERYINNSGNM